MWPVAIPAALLIQSASVVSTRCVPQARSTALGLVGVARAASVLKAVGAAVPVDAVVRWAAVVVPSWASS